MRGESNTAPPPPTVFLRKVAREYSASSYWLTAEHFASKTIYRLNLNEKYENTNYSTFNACGLAILKIV
jgi:hypothetical protein